MTSIVNVPLDAEARLELASMAYARWCEAFVVLKHVKAETWESAGKFCPKAEWPQHHEKRLQTAQAEYDKALRVSEAVKPYSPLVEQMREAGR